MSPFSPDPITARRWIIDVIAPIVGLALGAYLSVTGKLTPVAVPLILGFCTLPLVSRAPSLPSTEPGSGSQPADSPASPSGPGST